MVPAPALRDGRVRSCGALLCKPSKRVQVEVDPDFRPRLPRALTLGKLGKLHAEYHSLDRKLGIQAMAAGAGVATSTLQGAIAAVDRCGGWDKYVAKLGEK
jgi:hypothetical protein